MTDTPRVDAADVAARNKAREQLRSLEHQGEDYIWRTAKAAGDEWDRDRADLTACRAALQALWNVTPGRDDHKEFPQDDCEVCQAYKLVRAILQSTGEGEGK